MTQRFMTHFGMIAAIHLFLLVSSLTFITEEHALRHYGKRMLSLNLSKVSLPSLEAIQLPVRKTKRTVTPVAKTVAIPTAQPQVRPGSAPATVTGNALADLKTIYFSELRARIEENKFYPAVARRLQQEGEPIVGFTLLTDGSIIDIRIKKSSANPRLDQAALDAVKAVKKFKPLPKEVGESRMDFEIPVRFHLL